MNTADPEMFFLKREDVYVPFCIVVINKQKHCFVRKNWIASKPKRFLSYTISGKKNIGIDSGYYTMLLGRNVQ